MKKNAAQNTLSNRFAAKLASIKADKSLVGSHPIVDVSERICHEIVPIEKALPLLQELEPVTMQRNDLYRVENRQAKHLNEFVDPQAVFSIVELDGKWFLLDGNTRKRYWLSQKHSVLPSHLHFMVFHVENVDTATQFYETFDSKEAKKTNRDELMSLMRAAGADLDQLRSKLIAGGKLVSVIRNMTLSLVSCKRTSHARRVQVVEQHLAALLQTDTLNLNEGELKGGAVWAILRLYAEVPAKFHQYIDEYALELVTCQKGNIPLRNRPKTPQQTYDMAHSECTRLGVGYSGEQPIRIMAPVFLQGFELFAQEIFYNNGRKDIAFKRFLGTLKAHIITPECSRMELLRDQKYKLKHV